MIAVVRALAAAAGAAILLLATACSGDVTSATPSIPATDRVAEYVAAARALLPAGDSAALSDEQIAGAGAYICQAYASGPQETPPAQVRALHELTQRYCDVLTGLEGQAVGGGVGTQLSPRGAWPVTVGQTIDVYSEIDPTAVAQRVTVTAIEPITACPGKAVGDRGQLVDAEPEHGRFLVVDMTVVNTPDYDARNAGYYAGSAGRWDFVGASGAAVDDVATLPAFYCLRAGSVFAGMGPGRTYTGRVAIDLPREAGWLIFGQSQVTGPGYEFEIPAG